MPKAKKAADLMPKKQCRACGDDKPIVFFTRSQREPDGRRPVCQTCERKQNKAVKEMTLLGHLRAVERRQGVKPDTNIRLPGSHTGPKPPRAA